MNSEQPTDAIDGLLLLNACFMPAEDLDVPELNDVDHFDTDSAGTDDSLEVSLFDLDDLAETRRASLLSTAASPHRVHAPTPNNSFPKTFSGRKRLSYVAMSAERLDPGRIEKLLDQPCPCTRLVGGRSCMRHFNFGSIAGLRHARNKLGSTAEYQLRTSNLMTAAQGSTKDCRLVIDGKSICLPAYCMIFDYNASSMRRSWSKIKQGLGILPVGRPKNTAASSDPIADSILKQSCYAWLKAWAEVIADVDPVGIKYKPAVSYVRPKELHEEYVKHYMSNTVLLDSSPLSLRRFTEVWKYFQVKEKIRVRRKANTTTKCSGMLLALPQSSLCEVI